MRVRLTTDPDDRVVLESPFDRAFIDALKASIPWDGRSWDAERKRWLVTPLYATDLLEFLQSQQVEIQDDRAGRPGIPVAAPPMPPDLRVAFDTLFLAYAAPLCVAEASFKALSRYHHPDHAGNPELFLDINDAIQVIRSYLDPKPTEAEPDAFADVPF